jgi:hypothetical protein
VDRRYLNESNFVSEQQFKLRPDEWDATIDQYALQFRDEDYRVLNLATNTFNDSKPAASPKTTLPPCSFSMKSSPYAVGQRW